jgi:beta-glucosidase-like glycosyl hydrolase
MFRTALLLTCTAAAADPAPANAAFSADPIPARVAALLAQMTVEEKIAMTFAVHYGAAQAASAAQLKTGIGAIKLSTAGFKCGTNWTDCVAQRNAFQRRFVEGSRLGVPVSFINEGLHGGATGGTVFPMPVGQGAAWNASLVEAIAGAVAAQARAVGVEVVYAPVMNMMTDARFGRQQEGFGSEPTHTARMGAASARGLQGAAPAAAGGGGGGPAAASSYLAADKVVSLGKHFAAYGAAQGGLNGAAADVSNRTMHDYYLKPWRAFAKAGGRAAMAAHNTVDQVPMHAHKAMLGTTLRANYRFGDGVVLSDCNDIGVLADFRFAANATHAAALALAAGVDWDLQCGSDAPQWSYNKLQAALDAGLVSEAALDAAVRRVLTLKFATGAFDAPYADASKAAHLNTAAYRALAREAAVQSVVLLKNAARAPPPTPPTPPPPPTPAPAGCTAQDGVTIGVKQIAGTSKVVGSWGDCCAYCRAHGPACQAWTWVAPNATTGVSHAPPRTCYLKDNTDGREADSERVSGLAAPAAAAAQEPAPTMPRRSGGGGGGAPALPLGSLRGRSVALIGPTASSAAGMSSATAPLLGAYTLLGADVAANVSTLDRALADAGANATWAKGCVGDGSAPDAGLAEHLAEAVALAAASEIALLVLGDVEGQTCGEWHDRDSLDLPGGQLALLRAVSNASHAHGGTVVVILVHGRPATFNGAGGVGDNAALDGVDALLAAWRPGQEAGAALVALLQGDETPSGKLAQSWPRTVGHVGSGAAPWLQRRVGKWISNSRGEADADGRRYDNYVSSQFSAKPLFPFGFGLSYTTFAYTALAVAEAPGGAALAPGYDHAADAAVWTATVTLANTGARRGTEVVQVYAEDPAGAGGVVPFWKRLVGFARVTVEAGASATVAIPLLFDDVATHDSEMDFALAGGEYLITAGGSSVLTPLSQKVTLDVPARA